MKDYTQFRGGFELHHFVVPIPRNPALLGQDTSFTWRPGTGGYSKDGCYFGNYDTSRWDAFLVLILLLYFCHFLETQDGDYHWRRAYRGGYTNNDIESYTKENRANYFGKS